MAKNDESGPAPGCCFLFVLIPLVSMLTGYGWADSRYECVSLEPIKDQLLPASFTSLNAIDIKSIHTHMDSEDLYVYKYGVLAEGDLLRMTGSEYIKLTMTVMESATLLHMCYHLRLLLIGLLIPCHGHNGSLIRIKKMIMFMVLLEKL